MVYHVNVRKGHIMLCEMCGAEVLRTKFVKIEGAALHVCQKCAKFSSSEMVKVKTGEVLLPNVAERLASRDRRMKEKDILESSGEPELAPDYSDRVKKKRLALGLSHEDLARKVNEKKSIIIKVENCEMRPDDKLIKKLERALMTSLREKLEEQAGEHKAAGTQGMTLGDFIKHEK
jgi:putative transcription factor